MIGESLLLLGWFVSFPLGVGEGCTSTLKEDSSSAMASGRDRFERVETGALVTDRASTGGVTWIDFDGDGDSDLYVTNGYDVSSEEHRPQKNRFYVNHGDGTFSPLSEGPLVDEDGFSSGSTWGDFDNDGDLDVFVSNQRDQDNFLFRNEGSGVFLRLLDAVPAKDGGSSFSASWVDVDMDGRLDLFVTNGGLSGTGKNFLYRNESDGSFARITEGEIVTAEGGTCGAAWGDFDNDGDPDVYVTDRSFGGPEAKNALFRNDGHFRFTRIDRPPFSEDRVPTSAATWGDYDNDGDLDLYVATLYGLANLLYRNDGGGNFTRITEGPAVVDAGHSYGASWGDFDNDADLDLLVANWGAAPVLYRNDGAGRLDRSDAGDLGRSVLFAGSVAWGDYDGDGDLDLYVGNWPNAPGPGEENALYRNGTEAGHWLRVRLEGGRSNRSGIGARIRAVISTGGVSRTQIREVTAQSGWRSQSGLIQHFGLGGAETVKEITVRWPSGTVDRLSEVAADRWITVREGETNPQSGNGSAGVSRGRKLTH